MVSIGEGAKAKVAATFSTLGTSTLVVTSGSSSAGGARGGAGTQPTITWDDVAAIRELPEVGTVAPQMRRNLQVLSETANWQTQVVGSTPEWFTIRNWAVDRGEPITDADVGSQRKVAILGKTVATALFGDGVDPIGQTIRLDRTPFVVGGVLAAKGTAA